ncbi:MAG TPA: dihydrodipicolinate reductase C-terminal domain-containing protein [Candidatus Limnocylindrales bacterium]|nr:dihydrodipicolinate reductase C-terminal domain-containing protein [Candidatus Limnocylindrales bacterium]
MQHTPMAILGDGHLGWAVASAASERGQRTPVIGQPPGRRHDPTTFDGIDLVIDATVGSAVMGNVGAALDAGVRRFVMATTGWTDDRETVDAALRAAGASAVAASNFSLGVALFARLVAVAAELFGATEGFDPYLLEWHRRGKADRPSGTALELARRVVDSHPAVGSIDDLELVSLRAGASPGMHLVGFDAPGESIELRHTARDRSAYAIGVLAAADWLTRTPRAPGIHPFDPVIDELLARPSIAA